MNKNTNEKTRNAAKAGFKESAIYLLVVTLCTAIVFVTKSPVLYFPMLIFSGTTLPLEVMPKAMQKTVSVFPLTQGLTMMKNTFLGVSTGSILLPLCVMIGVAALCTILVVRFFRWE